MGKASPHPKGGPKLTQQHMEGVTDINKIMERHNRTGVFGSGRPNGKQPQFIQLSGDSFHEMLIKVQNAQGIFAAQPAKIRKRFGNNPENFLRFFDDPNNLREAVSLGLVDGDTLSPEQREQMDLVRLSEDEEKRQFEEWRKSRKPGHVNPEAEPFVPDEPATARRADSEAQPSFSRKKGRTSNT